MVSNEAGFHVFLVVCARQCRYGFTELGEIVFGHRFDEFEDRGFLPLSLLFFGKCRRLFDLCQGLNWQARSIDCISTSRSMTICWSEGNTGHKADAMCWWLLELSQFFN